MSHLNIMIKLFPHKMAWNNYFQAILLQMYVSLYLPYDNTLTPIGSTLHSSIPPVLVPFNI